MPTSAATSGNARSSDSSRSSACEGVGSDLAAPTTRSTPPPSAPPAAPDRDALTRDHFRFFSVAVAISVIFHQSALERWDFTSYDVPLTFAAFWVIFRGGPVIAMLALAAIQVFAVVADSPTFSNHWGFVAILNIGLLMSWLLLAATKRTGRVDPAELYRTFAPVGRWCVCILYFYVVFHKLNWGFLDPERSAAITFYQHQASRIPLLPDTAWAAHASIYATLLIEAAIPILLCIRRTFVAGIVLGFAFHAMVGLSPLGRFWDFSSMVFACYLLFGPENMVQFWRDAWHRREELTLYRWYARSPARWQALAALAIAGGFVLFQFTRFGHMANTGVHKPFLYYWPPYVALYALVVFPPLFLGTKRFHGPRLRLARPLLAFAPALLFFIGANPYLGLKTEGTLVMFSNLLTENGRTNHILVPASAQIFNYQREVVEILDSSEPTLRHTRDAGRMLTLFELKVAALRHPDESVRFAYQGNEYSFDRMADHGGMLEPPSWLMRKYFGFKPFWADGLSRYSH